jgi:hypothetical protein
MRDLRTAGAGLANRGRRVKRNGGRLLFSGVGFAAAYFLDPAQGSTRRRRVQTALGSRMRAGTGTSQPPTARAPEDPIKSDHGSHPQFTTNGLSPVAY